MPTWDPVQYLRFAEERTRPCLDLTARIALAAPRRIVDLGCGPGNSTEVLARRWPDADLIGVDSSPEMIAAAQSAQPLRRWLLGEISQWATQADGDFDLVFSNAALQWVPDHQTLVPKLIGRVARAGALAVQVPYNFDAPAHRIARELATSSPWKDRFPKVGVREWEVLNAPQYYDIVAPLADRIDLWETEYLLVMAGVDAIVDWYRGTGLRPFLESLSADEDRRRFLNEYQEALRTAYPLRSDGRILFPFRRLFLIAYR